MKMITFFFVPNVTIKVIIIQGEAKPLVSEGAKCLSKAKKIPVTITKVEKIK